MRLRDSSIRTRLTVVYGVVLVVSCTALLALTHALLYGRLYAQLNAPDPPPRSEGTVEAKLQVLQQQQAEIAHLRTEALLDTAVASAVALAVVVVLGLGVCWFVAGRMLLPLRTLTAATRRISQDRLDERIALTGPQDELKELADTFDEMVSRLEASFTSQRRFVADAAHELRTPLAIVRTSAEVQLDKRHTTPEQWEAMARRALVATGRAERLLDGLLALARSDSGALVTERYDLALAAAAALADADAEAEAAGVTVGSDLRSAPVTGDPALLDRLLSNVVDNAVRHNGPHGWVEVTTCVRGGQSVVEVRNSGAMVPAQDVDRLFEPFQRLDAQRVAGSRSTGLGLTIVRSIVRAHAGTVSAEPNPGGGLTLTISLPVASDDDATPADTPGDDTISDLDAARSI